MTKRTTSAASTFARRGARRTWRVLLSAVSSVLILFLGIPGFGVGVGVGAQANPAADLDQCANGGVGAPDLQCTGANWQNGNLNANQAHYNEGDSVPYRLRFSNLIDGTHTVVIEWDTTQSGKHALDYLTAFNRTETDADPTSGVAGLPDPTTYPIPVDPNISSELTQIPGVFTLWGGTITNVSAYTYTGDWPDGNSSASLSITFTSTVADPVLAWGGHIATRADWGSGSSAVDIAGSPFHMRLIGLDGAGGNQDRSLSNGAVIFPGSITVVKDAVPDGTTAFAFTTTGGLSPAGFSLVDDGAGPGVASQTYPNLTTFTTYTVTESAAAGWTLSAIACNDPSGGSTTDTATRTATIDLDEAEDITCTFTNANIAPTIEVTKTANPTAVPETGGNVTFDFVVQNTSTGEPVTLTSLSDSVYGTLAGDGDCQVGTVLAAAGSCSFSITRFVEGDFSGPDHVDVFTAHAVDGGGADASDTDDATVDFTNVAPSIQVTKTANPTAVPETGGNVTFTFVVQNTSTEEPVTITSLSDSVFGTLAGDADCAVGTVLAAGASCTFSISRLVEGDYTGVDHIDVFTAHAADNDGTDATDDDDATVDFTDVAPLIQVTKSANPIAVPETGGNVVFTFVVTNTSSEEPVTITSLSDDVYGTLAGDADCAVGTVLAAGASCSFSIIRWVEGDFTGPDHVDVFTAHAVDDDGTDASDADDATVDFTNVAPSVSVTKTANPTAVPETGGNVTFTFTVQNTSTEEPVTITSLTDDVYGALAGDGDCQVGTVLPAAGSCTFTLTRWVEGDHSGADHVDVFTAHAVDDDGTEATDDDNATVDFIDVLPAIAVTKTASPTAVPETGGEVTFTFVVTNGGLEAATITSLADSVYGALAGGGDCKVGTVLTAGASCSFSITRTVEGDASGADHVDVLTAVAEDDDGNEDTASDDATVDFTDVKPVIDVDKTATPETVRVGEPVTYTYVVTNPGFEPVVSVTVTDDRCSPATYVTGDTDGDSALDPGEAWTFRCTAALTGTTVNTGTATGSDAEGNKVTDTDTARVVVVTPMIAIDKTASTATAPPGESVTFTYVVTNPGDDALTSVTVGDNRCGPVTFVSGDADGDAALDPGETWTYTCTTAMPDVEGEVTNIGRATGTDRLGGTVSADDTVTVTVDRLEVAGVVLVKTGTWVLRSILVAVGLLLAGAVLVVGSRRRHLVR